MNTLIYPVTKLKFWPQFLIHMRPYLLFISGIAGVSGMVIGIEDASMNASYILAFFAFFLSYGFGQALTDCYQVDTDSISASYRPLSKGIISVRDVKIISLLGLLFCVIFLLLPNLRNLLFGLLSIFGLYTYTYIKKTYWAGGPFHNAWIVALLPIMGFMVTSGGTFGDLWNRSLLFIALLNFFAYMNFVLIGYLKDISADRATGYKTFPVVWGWNNTVIVGTFISLVTIVLCGILIEWTIMPVSFFIVAGLISLAGNFMAINSKTKEEKDAEIPILMTIRSFVLWNLAVIISIIPALLIYGIGFYFFFELVLKYRPERAQI